MYGVRAGLVIFGVNYYTAFVWACAAVCGTQTHHSGYRWPYTLPFDEQPCVMPCACYIMFANVHVC